MQFYRKKLEGKCEATSCFSISDHFCVATSPVIQNNKCLLDDRPVDAGVMGTSSTSRSPLTLCRTPLLGRAALKAMNGSRVELATPTRKWQAREINSVRHCSLVQNGILISCFSVFVHIHNQIPGGRRVTQVKLHLQRAYTKIRTRWERKSSVAGRVSVGALSALNVIQDEQTLASPYS